MPHRMLEPNRRCVLKRRMTESFANWPDYGSCWTGVPPDQAEMQDPKLVEPVDDEEQGGDGGEVAINPRPSPRVGPPVSYSPEC